MLDGAPIAIGDECMIASGVQLITATHPVDPAARRGAWEQALPVTLARRRLDRRRRDRLPRRLDRREHRRRRRLVVTRDLPAGVVAYGNPARVVREIGERDRVTLP